MESTQPWTQQQVDLSSDESNSSDVDVPMEDGYFSQLLDNNDLLSSNFFRDITSEGALIKRAEMYQDYMKRLGIPSNRGSLIPNVTWVGLGKSIKKLYAQPLHYLTNDLLKQWDQLRFGTGDEHQPLDSIIHPSKAEATIWMIEEVHRQTSSHLHIAKLWQCDAMYHMSIDPIFPNL